MTVSNVRRLMAAMREYGASRIKVDNVEIELCLSQSGTTIITSDLPINNMSAVVPPVTDEVEHKIEELKSVMSLGDEDLINRLFPAPLENENEAVN